MNAVAFYRLNGRLLVVLHEVEGGMTACTPFKNVEPNRIAATLDEYLGFPFKAMCLVMSAREGSSSPIPRAKPEYGLGLSLYCEVNTLANMPVA
jgi:hypothetical protein